MWNISTQKGLLWNLVLKSSYSFQLDLNMDTAFYIILFVLKKKKHFQLTKFFSNIWAGTSKKKQFIGFLGTSCFKNYGVFQSHVSVNFVLRKFSIKRWHQFQPVKLLHLHFHEKFSLKVNGPLVVEFLWVSPSYIYLFKFKNIRRWERFKVNNKDTRITSMTSFWLTSFWY